MTQEIHESAGSSDFPMPIDYKEVLLSQKAPLTITILGIEVEKEKPFTKQDFKDALKKVRSSKKSYPHAKGKSET